MPRRFHVRRPGCPGPCGVRQRPAVMVAENPGNDRWCVGGGGARCPPHEARSMRVDPSRRPIRVPPKRCLAIDHQRCSAPRLPLRSRRRPEQVVAARWTAAAGATPSRYGGGPQRDHRDRSARMPSRLGRGGSASFAPNEAGSVLLSAHLAAALRRGIGRHRPRNGPPADGGARPGPSGGSGARGSPWPRSPAMMPGSAANGLVPVDAAVVQHDDRAG